MLDTAKLENVKVRDGKTTAACPACREAGHDRRGEHLVLFENDKFGCVTYPGDSADAQNHRKDVFRLVGVQSKPSAQTGKSEPIRRCFSPLKVPVEGENDAEPIILGRFGRSFQPFTRAQARACAPKSPEQPSEASENWQDMT